jgi:hypothetical protein
VDAPTLEFFDGQTVLDASHRVEGMKIVFVVLQSAFEEALTRPALRFLGIVRHHASALMQFQ